MQSEVQTLKQHYPPPPQSPASLVSLFLQRLFVAFGNDDDVDCKRRRVTE